MMRPCYPNPFPKLQWPRRPSTVPVAPSTIYDNMVAAWVTGFEFHLPTEWDDALGNVYQLTPDGTPTLAGSGGKWTANVADFDGASLLFRDDAALAVPTSLGFTVAAWVWLDNVTDAHTVIAKRDASNIEYELSFNPTLRRFVWKHHEAGQLVTWTLAGTIAAGRWYHVSVSMRNTGNGRFTPFFAVNGVGVNALGSNTAASTPSGNTLYLGGSFGGYLNGKLADVCMWQRELTPANLLALMSLSIVDQLSAPITAAADGSGGFPSYPAQTAPATAPTSFGIDETGARPVLSWIAENVNSFAVEIQRDDGGGFVTIDEVSDTNEFTDDATELPGTASYRVRSVNMFGASAWSSTVTLGGVTAGLTTDDGTVTTDDGTVTTDES